MKKCGIETISYGQSQEIYSKGYQLQVAGDSLDHCCHISVYQEIYTIGQDRLL